MHPLIDLPALQQRLADGNTVLLDCRFSLADPQAGRRAYLSGHIPGAQFADLEQDLSAPVSAASGRHPLPDPTLLAQRCAAWGIDADTLVVVYDDMGGAMAARCWWLLRWLGHDGVVLLDGGLPVWERAGLALQTGEVAAPAAAFDLRLRADWVVEGDAVADNLSGGQFVLVDARAPERFRGEQEPIDPVAGHVPGALNRPLNLNLDSAGQFKPAAVLRREWQALLGERPAAEAVMMCGSGVTACHNLLALTLAGLDGARLYAGSWSAWIRDPQHPVAVA